MAQLPQCRICHQLWLWVKGINTLCSNSVLFIYSSYIFTIKLSTKKFKKLSKLPNSTVSLVALNILFYNNAKMINEWKSIKLKSFSHFNENEYMICNLLEKNFKFGLKVILAFLKCLQQCLPIRPWLKNWSIIFD